MRGLDFRCDGAALFPAVLSPRDLEDLRALADVSVGARPGARLSGAADLSNRLAATGVIGSVAARLSSSAARPVRAVIFDKSHAANWAVAWHQDRVIPVRGRRDVEGFGPWTTKDGLTHVAPPFDLLARMVTLRVHLDTVEAHNAPLRIALGSHRLGRVSADKVAVQAQGMKTEICLAQAGDVWAYSTPILHASDRAELPGRRRVLQVDYADFDLPGGLHWLGLDPQEL
jgi:hypothetical protein